MTTQSEPPPLSALLDAGEAYARHVLLERKLPEMTGFYHLISPTDGEDELIPAIWRNAVEKEAVVLAVKNLAHEMDAIAACLCIEAWMARVSSSAILFVNVPTELSASSSLRRTEPKRSADVCIPFVRCRVDRLRLLSLALS